MSCNPCAITVNPQKVGLVVDYLAGGARPEYKAGGFVVRPQNIGMIIAACKIPATGPSEIIIEPVNTVGITVEAGTPDIIVEINQELDPVCDWETGVTITVNGTPVNILSVTPVGDSDPWGYTYEVDVTLNFGETIVWDYDAAVGDICALSGTKLTDSTETTIATCDPPHALSSNVVWVAGAGAPTLAGAQWRANVPDASVNDPTASTIANVSSDTGKYYAEFSLCDDGGLINDLFGYGWKRSDQLANVTQVFLAGIWWFHTNSVWRFNSDLNSSNGVDFDVQPPFPVRGQVFGVALDCSANKLYLNYNGAWLTTGGGASGGDPSSGNGWAIVNPSNSVTLYSFCQSNNVVLQADDPKYLPSGYTPVTGVCNPFVNTPPAVSGYAIWLNPDTITASGGNVTGWVNDATATAVNADLTQTGAVMPETTTNCGAAIVQSVDNTSRYLTAASPHTIPSGFTLFVVGKFDLLTDSGSAIVDGTASGRALYAFIGNDYSIQGDAVGILTDMPEDGATHVFAGRFDSTNYRARISGNIDGWETDASAVGQTWTYANVLQSRFGTQATGWCGEIIVYKEGLSDAAMNSVYDALVTKWNL